MDRDEEKSIEVPAFYQKLGGARDTLYTFDNSPEAWLWKDLLDQREEACINAAAAIIEVYTELGSYPSSGEDFHHLAVFMGSLRWLTWGGGGREGMCPVKCVNRLARFHASLLSLACYQLRLLLPLFLALQLRQ
jgi:hypothetical protein